MNFKHDCDKCTSLGEFIYDKEKFDLYWCASAVPFPSMIARYGNSGHEYISYPLHSGLFNQPLFEPVKEILARATELGLYKI